MTAFSRCFNCNSLSIWIYDKLMYPITGGAPALIRLAIQKMCIELGQPGKNINDDIGALVSVGLDQRVQKALDTVRVIGNEAVHPGQIDLRDDRASAETLFRLLNLVAEKMISEPKHVDEVYASLPDSKLTAIEKRDGKNS